MKMTKWTFLGLTALFAGFSSCQKNISETQNENYFTYEGKNYPTGAAYYSNDFIGSGYVQVFLTTTLQADNGANAVEFGFYKSEIPTSGTFTAHYFDTADFDSTKNFDEAMVGLNFSKQSLSYGTLFMGTEGPDATDFYKMDGSTVTVSKNGDNYTFVYELHFLKDGKTSVVKGQYTGKVLKE
ncbi:hypothetical protein [Pinibacter soli]|uniref:Lipoprotein n=1 Tax=Pinibacter soli TaxID=3044211 RepID=A0ABT6RER5_9BACT|nr:hypothetical protein [Pinibacter soli]MDI3321067.1 hypothetical protein [Pinibacter soli]